MKYFLCMHHTILFLFYFRAKVVTFSVLGSVFIFLLYRNCNKKTHMLVGWLKYKAVGSALKFFDIYLFWSFLDPEQLLFVLVESEYERIAVVSTAD